MAKIKLKVVKRSERFDGSDMLAWRDRHGLDPVQAGDALGLSKRAIYYYEAGTRSIPKTVALLCDAYDQGYKGIDKPAEF
jgi:hypothetical protein